MKSATPRALSLAVLAVLAPLALCLAAVPAVAATRNVPAQYATIHAAVQASAPGDIVLVAAGTYTDCTHPTEGAGTTPACVILKTGVTIRGAGPAATIIDAQGLGRGIFGDGVSNCSVENLQVRGAYAQIFGAGILLRNVPSSVTITDVRVTACNDGGVVCINNASPVLTRLEIDNNLAKQGGGLAIEESSSPQVTDCSIHHNTAPSGAGIFIRTNCSPVLDGCTISFNVINASFGNGGGIAVQSATPTITDCVITDNETLGYGGGVAFVQDAGGLLENCSILRNDAAGTYSLGGGVAVSQSAPVLRSNVIALNTCSGFYAEGGGIDVSFTPSPTIENCTIADNATSVNGFGGGISVQWGAEPVITRCIIAGADAGQGVWCLSATPVITCSDVWGNAGGDALCGTDGGGNFALDPGFCGTVAKPYGLVPGSSCAPGSRPGAPCNGLLVGALPAGCGASAAPLPLAAKLDAGNTPNPFNPATTIWFELRQAGPVTLRIHDVRGAQVYTRTWDQAAAGRTELTWRGIDDAGRPVPSGVYLYRVESAGTFVSRRMSLIR
ncbi:MAG: right-handed parallel beta-helix repeat-containing protein [bacterium]|nr:right-handed parallel beta-helix repeat-containing protein [bacterium]